MDPFRPMARLAWQVTKSKSIVSRSVLVKSAKSSTINFDPTFMGQNEVQKNKLTPYCLTKFHGES
jgi:hypothetical protein